MKKPFRIVSLLLTLALLLSAVPALAASSGIAIDEAHFPCAFFRECIQQFDTDSDGYLSKAERNSVKEIEAVYWGEGEDFTSIDGIKYFPNLQSLYVEALFCDHVDFSSNKKLTTIDFLGCGINSINVKKNTRLTTLRMDYVSLTEVDVSKNTKLERLFLRGAELKKLDVSKNKQLTYLDVSGNKLTSLNVKKNTKLQTLECAYNKLKKLDVTKNTKLARLNCVSNKLTTLNLSKNTLMTGLMAYYNPGLKKLDISNCKKLQKLIASNKKKKSNEGDSFIYWGNIAYDGEGVSKTVSISPYTTIVAGKKTLYKGK